MNTVSKFLMTDETGKDIAVAIQNVAEAIYTKNYRKKVYGFHVDPTESDPEKAVTYLEDAVNMLPAGMNYTSGAFNYGSWSDAFFMPKPCMLKRDGTVDFYLDPSDYTKKADGETESHIAHLGAVESSTTAAAAYAADDYFVLDGTLYQATSAIEVGDTITAGTNCVAIDGIDANDNAMMEWGQNGELIWAKAVADTTGDGFSVYIANYKADNDYHAWSFYNNQGKLVNHFYTPIYGGSLVNSRLRSISGKQLMASKTAENEISYAKANNADSNVLWFTETFSDHILIQYLLVLMGKSLDSQSVFGRGIDSGSQAACEAYRTGLLNDKGLFFGYSDGSHTVKVFGMENYWACQWRRKAGCINSNGTYKLKYTYGTQDGSTVNGYPATSLTSASTFSGYISSGSVPTASANYIVKMAVTNEGAIVPADVTGGGSNKYYCDAMWSNNSQVDYAYFGGISYYGADCGLFAWYVHSTASAAGWGIGAALSCKPLA